MHEHLVRIVLPLAIFLFPPGAQAQRADLMPWMTGERLVKLMGNVDPATIEWTPASPFRSAASAAAYRDLANGEFVHGYIEAVHDASEGIHWCWSPSKPMPHDLDTDLRNALQRMSETQLKRNAAELIIEHWRKKFPCAVVQSRRGR